MSYFPEKTKIFFSTLPSTHDWVKAHLDSFSTSSFISVRAEKQTNGHGQFKRKWVSPKGGIFATFCIPLTSTFQVTSLAMVLASSILAVLVARGVYPKIKWPNDLLLNGAKFAGVLVEICKQKQGLVVLCSFGMNVNVDIDELKAVDQEATSLSHATEKLWPLEELFTEIEEQFQRDILLFTETGYAPFQPWIQEWDIRTA